VKLHITLELDPADDANVAPEGEKTILDQVTQKPITYNRFGQALGRPLEVLIHCDSGAVRLSAEHCITFDVDSLQLSLPGVRESAPPAPSATGGPSSPEPKA
jgi:hypothetical protein